ncbi:MAG: hypothetical protein IPG91_05550 [Ideonella sp.]|nr:hypothetical protein [Ideonella sp.]
MIFLHIGLNKSGSSSIQAFCDRHRQVLHEHGLDYPRVGIHDAAHYGVSKRLIGRRTRRRCRTPTASRRHCAKRSAPAGTCC